VSNTFNIADLSPFFGPEGSESRSTLSQEGEDDEDINHDSPLTNVEDKHDPHYTTQPCVEQATMSTRVHWFERERNDYNIRWIHSLLIMSMHLLRMIYYLIEVQCLYSSLKNTPWMDRPLSVQRKQVEDDMLLSRFWLPNSWWILYQSRWFQPKCYIWMERWWSLLSYVIDGTSIGAP
jgi:hypothetical protein